jgi:hypothetical protein
MLSNLLLIVNEIIIEINGDDELGPIENDVALKTFVTNTIDSPPNFETLLDNEAFVCETIRILLNHVSLNEALIHFEFRFFFFLFVSNLQFLLNVVFSVICFPHSEKNLTLLSKSFTL